MPKQKLRIAATGDLHFNRSSPAVLQPWLSQAVASADVLLLCGDLTDNGLPEEAAILARELAAAVTIPMIAVLGNHDFHSGKQDEIKQIFVEAGVRVLAGEACVVEGVGFAGVKGFVGGFGRRVLEPWGEDLVKDLVREGVDEALRLESALARLATPTRIAVLHYAPVLGTVEGEPPEIFAFLGCGRLEEPLNRYRVAAAFHGHAHHGQPEGRTQTGIPVYNVSLPLLRRVFPDRPPYRLLEVDTDPEKAR
jgi:Icc-related predicted phosphoesterase